MNDSTLMLYEAADRWAGPLRRALEPCGVQLVQAGSLAGCARELLGGRSRLAAVEVQPATLKGVLELLIRVARSRPRAGVIVLADRGLARLDGVFREAGALHCEFSPRDPRMLARLVARWWAREAPPVPLELSLWPEPLAEIMAHWLADPAA